MSSEEPLGPFIQSILDGGYELSIDVIARATVPAMPMHWANGLSTKMGTIKVVREGFTGFSWDFETKDDEHEKEVFKILKKYKQWAKRRSFEKIRRHYGLG